MDETMVHIWMRNAILVASLSQEYQTIDNVTVRGNLGLSVTQFLRGTPEIG